MKSKLLLAVFIIYVLQFIDAFILYGIHLYILMFYVIPLLFVAFRSWHLDKISYIVLIFLTALQAIEVHAESFNYALVLGEKVYHNIIRHNAIVQIDYVSIILLGMIVSRYRMVFPRQGDEDKEANTDLTSSSY